MTNCEPSKENAEESHDHLWQSELKSALRSPQQASEFFNVDFPHTPYSIFIPLKFAHKIKEQGMNGPLAKQFLPHADEMSELQNQGFYDPIGDSKFARGGQLIHRYTNRVLFTPTTACPIHCRYCFRKNELNQRDRIFDADFATTLTYLRAHPEIEELIFTGGDPLMLGEQRLDFYFNEFSQISHLKFIRIHSRMPIIIPSRITASFGSLLAKYSSRFTIHLSLHINHVSEWCKALETNIENFIPRTVHLLAQTVLLKGLNDTRQSLLALFQLLHSKNIRPYYLHHPDLVKGGMHFWLSLEEGQTLYRELKMNAPGWLLPQYVLDTPHGGGKINAWSTAHNSKGVITDIHGNNQNYPQILH